MMNKLKSAKVNLLRFLFVLPLLAVILLSFREEIKDTLKRSNSYETNVPSFTTDTVPLSKKITDKGYNIEIWKNKEKDNPMIVIKDKNKKEVERLTIDEWNTRRNYYVNLYGELPPPPPPPAPSSKQAPPPPPASPAPPPPPPNKQLDIVVNTLKGDVEKVNATLDEPYNGAKLVGVKNSNGQNPLIVLDGEIVSNDVLAKLDSKSIQSIDVLKDKSATALYADKGKDGVLIIKTKSKESKEDNPLIVLDGKIITKGEMDNLSPHSIESVNVLKGKTATELYQEKGKDGVIVITTKKK
jgi:TonB-dependent SusC/RagA subfamily outer membrane receptor